MSVAKSSYRNDGHGNWYDDPRMGVPRGFTAAGDERLTWDAALFCSHGANGFATWEVHVDGEPSGLQVCGSSASDARRNLRKQWVNQVEDPFPGHKQCVLRYVETEG